MREYEFRRCEVYWFALLLDLPVFRQNCLFVPVRSEEEIDSERQNILKDNLPLQQEGDSWHPQRNFFHLSAYIHHILPIGLQTFVYLDCLLIDPNALLVLNEDREIRDVLMRR